MERMTYLCAACGRPIPTNEMDLPCPTESCGSLDREVRAHDEGHGADEEKSIEQEGEVPPRSWRDQWGRTLRWYDRLRSTAEGRPHEIASLNYEDEMYAFFESCFHLKDWLKNDPAQPLRRRRDVEDFIDHSEPLRWCADIANGSKHLVANLRHRIDPTTALSRRHYAITLGPGMPTTITGSYLIIGGGQTRDAMKLAAACNTEWECFLRDNDLLP